MPNDPISRRTFTAAGGGPASQDRYEIHGEIASGGMATVHLGRVRGAGGFARTVAIKKLHPQFAKDPEFVAMLLDEARLVARVRHPNVVPTLDVVSTDGEVFLVMEYVAGEQLAGLVQKARKVGGRIPADIAATVMCDALAGLHAAHEARTEDDEPLEIVHRDVSPQNVMVGQDGVTRVLDFGIARAAVRSHSTREGQIKGKFRYMAPEQLRGATATRRSDVYAASVVFWEALTSGKAFAGENEAEVFGLVIEGMIEPPSRLAPLPGELDAVVMRGLSRDPAERFATALEMAEAIEASVRLASSRQVSAWLESIVGGRLAKRARLVTEMEAGRLPPPASGPQVPELDVPPASTARSGERLRRAIPSLETDNEPTVLDPAPKFPEHERPPAPLATSTRVSPSTARETIPDKGGAAAPKPIAPPAPISRPSPASPPARAAASPPPASATARLSRGESRWRSLPERLKTSGKLLLAAFVLSAIEWTVTRVTGHALTIFDLRPVYITAPLAALGLFHGCWRLLGWALED